VKFIAIGRENQPIAGVNLPGEHQETQDAAPGRNQSGVLAAPASQVLIRR
jgi:hypothetical protein